MDKTVRFLQDKLVGQLCFLAEATCAGALWDGHTEPVIVLIVSVEPAMKKASPLLPDGEVEGILVEYIMGEKVEWYWTASATAKKIFDVFHRVRE